MTLADLERVSFRRHGRARVIRTASRAPTEPHVFYPNEAATAWIAEMRGAACR